MANEDNKPMKKSKKLSKKSIYFLIILTIILAYSFILWYDYITSDDCMMNELSQDYSILNKISNYITINLVNYNLIDTSAIQKTVKRIGKNSLGTVTVEGPYGNNESSIKVAYILGQHPREYYVHNVIYKSILNLSDALNYSYYIYKINVSAESIDFEKSRMNGQLLAHDYVVNHIIKNNYNLAIDIHSSNGGYVQNPYIFTPTSIDNVAYESANNITKALSYIIYYEPASYSSPQYSTIPIENGGVPTIVFEMRGNPDYSLETEAVQFIQVVDKLFI